MYYASQRSYKGHTLLISYSHQQCILVHLISSRQVTVSLHSIGAKARRDFGPEVKQRRHLNFRRSEPVSSKDPAVNQNFVMAFLKGPAAPPLPTKDILSWMFDEPAIDVNKPVYSHHILHINISLTPLRRSSSMPATRASHYLSRKPSMLSSSLSPACAFGASSLATVCSLTPSTTSTT